MNLDPDGDELRARVRREELAHDGDDVLTRSYELKTRFSHTTTYPSRKRLDAELASATSDLEGLHVLDYGCGRGAASLDYLRAGASVVGIDISSAYVQSASAAAELAGFDKGHAQFQVMDAHQLEFSDASFDRVIGHGIIHHLDVRVAMAEVARVLRPGGQCFFLEPLSGNPLLKVFRALTPSARTDDELPLGSAELAALVADRRWKSRMNFCGIVSAPVAAFTSIVLPSRPDNALLRAADVVERAIHGRGVLLSWNQYVLLRFERI
jgi:ubiquinone/menaquinone biosynthesis C-methylase UbiE